jgi:hypothetical protein
VPDEQLLVWHSRGSAPLRVSYDCAILDVALRVRRSLRIRNQFDVSVPAMSRF